MNLEKFRPYVADIYTKFFWMDAGAEHYRLLAYLSTCYNNSTIIDLGTDKGCSAAPQTTHDRFQRLLVRQSSRWARSTTQPFRLAEKAPPTSAKLNKKKALIRSVETLVHKRRGHLSIPRFKLGNARLAVKDIRPRHPA